MPSTSVLPIFLLLVASTRSVPVQSSHDALQESILLRQFHHEAAELSKPILLQLDGGKHFKVRRPHVLACHQAPGPAASQATIDGVSLLGVSRRRRSRASELPWTPLMRAWIMH